LTRPAWLLVGLVALQIGLGGLVVLSGRDIAVNTAHVANGALTLATSLVVTLRVFRPLICENAEEAAAMARAAA
jgi:heme A synthase